MMVFGDHRRPCQNCGKPAAGRRVRCLSCGKLVGRGCCYASMGSRGTAEGAKCSRCDDGGTRRDAAERRPSIPVKSPRPNYWIDNSIVIPGGWALFRIDGALTLAAEHFKTLRAAQIAADKWMVGRTGDARPERRRGMPKKRLWEVRKLTEEPVLGTVNGSSVKAAGAAAVKRFGLAPGEVVLREIKAS